MHTYPKYKDSGVPWLGEIPDGWQVVRLGSKFVERKSKVSDKEYPPLSVTKMGIVPQLDSAAKTNDGDNRKEVCKGDFVINSRSDRKGSSGISNYNGSVSLINIVLNPIGFENLYIHNYLRSKLFQEEFYRVGQGIVADLWSTKYSEMRKIMICVPSFNEQQKIAQYLDWQSSKINKFIKAKKKLISLLREQKQNIINQAVTKGINPNVKMKDSGVEWLGEIPEHWEIRKFKYCFKNINDTSDSCGNDEKYVALENIEGWSGKINFYSDDIEFQSKVKRFKKNDILLNKLRPYLAKIALPKFNGVCVSEFLVLRKSFPLNEKYFSEMLRSKRFIELINSSTYGARMPRADWGFIGSCFLCVPPTLEQSEIYNFIQNETVFINKVIEKSEAEINLIKEYRDRLISDIVTGKIDIRSIDIPDYEPVDNEIDDTEQNEDDDESAMEEETE